MHFFVVSLVLVGLPGCSVMIGGVVLCLVELCSVPFYSIPYFSSIPFQSIFPNKDACINKADNGAKMSER